MKFESVGLVSMGKMAAVNTDVNGGSKRFSWDVSGWPMLVWALLSIVIFFLVIIMIFAVPSCGVVTVTNASSVAIKSLDFSVCDVSAHVVNLRPHDCFQLAFPITKDSHYSASVKFADGRTSKMEVGYLSNLFDSTETVSIGETALTLTKSEGQVAYFRRLFGRRRSVHLNQ